MSDDGALVSQNVSLPAIADPADVPRALDLDSRRIDERIELIPVDDLNNAITLLKARQLPTTPERGVFWAKAMLGCWPNAKIAEPKIYTRAIASLFAEAPDDLCKAAVDFITCEMTFVPSRAEVNKVLKRLKAERSWRIGTAQAMLREHERRNHQRIEEEKRADERARFVEKYGDRSPLDVANEIIENELKEQAEAQRTA